MTSLIGNKSILKQIKKTRAKQIKQNKTRKKVKQSKVHILPVQKPCTHIRQHFALNVQNKRTGGKGQKKRGKRKRGQEGKGQVVLVIFFSFFSCLFFNSCKKTVTSSTLPTFFYARKLRTRREARLPPFTDFFSMILFFFFCKIKKGDKELTPIVVGTNSGEREQNKDNKK